MRRSDVWWIASALAFSNMGHVWVQLGAIDKRISCELPLPPKYFKFLSNYVNQAIEMAHENPLSGLTFGDEMEYGISSDVLEYLYLTRTTKKSFG